MARKPTLEKELNDVMEAALGGSVPNSHPDGRPDKSSVPIGSGDIPANNSTLRDALDQIKGSEQDQEQAFEELEQALESDTQTGNDAQLTVTGLSGSLIDAEVRDNIADACEAQDREITRTLSLLELIDTRLEHYADVQEKLNRLVANAKRRRVEVEAAHDAAQLARALLNTKRSKRSVD